MPDLMVAYRPIGELTPYARNARTHSRRQVRRIADSIARFGFANPILVSAAGEVIAGHARLAAAKLLGLERVPTVCLAHLSEAERRAYILADNRLALSAGWDRAILRQEFAALADLDFDTSLTGFATTEIDLILAPADEAAATGNGQGAAAPAPPPPAIPTAPPPADPAVTRLGDRWQLGRHSLLCADPHHPAIFAALLGHDPAMLIVPDPHACDTIVRRWEEQTGGSAAR